MIRFSPHLEILPEVQRWIYPRLQNLKKLGFVLYGGTALALQLGHRQSVDFDFFLHDPLDQKQLRDAFPLFGRGKSRHSASGLRKYTDI